MACCCKNDRTNRVAVSCLNRCDLPKHQCLEREDIRPGPVPRHMGWLYTAKDSPEHQLRCGWRPGHISCPVLRRIEAHNCGKCGSCFSCDPPPPLRPPCQKPSSCCGRCGPIPPFPCPTCPSSGGCKNPCSVPCNSPLIRIIRHAGKYSIVTKPSNITNHPSGPFPLKYVLNTDPGADDTNAKFLVEAKFNDLHFDYSSSQSSFVLDFSPPENKCMSPCPRRSAVCFNCQKPEETPSEKPKAKK